MMVDPTIAFICTTANSVEIFTREHTNTGGGDFVSTAQDSSTKKALAIGEGLESEYQMERETGIEPATLCLGITFILLQVAAESPFSQLDLY